MTRITARLLPFAGILLLAPGLAAAQAKRGGPRQSKPPTVTVSAQGSVQAQPDTAAVEFQISGQDPEVKAAYAQAQQQAEQLRAQLRQQGFTPAEAHWSQYAVSPNWDYQAHRVTSYSVTADVQLLVTHFGRLAPLMNAVSGSGSSALRGVRFELRHKAAARRQAIAAAYAEAHAQAEALAAAAGVKLGTLVSASVNAAAPVSPAVRLMAAAAAPGPTAQFAPQALTVTANVTAVFLLQRP